MIRLATDSLFHWKKSVQALGLKVCDKHLKEKVQKKLEALSKDPAATITENTLEQWACVRMPDTGAIVDVNLTERNPR